MGNRTNDGGYGRTRYCLTAGVLGAGWFVVLLIPGIAREWLLADVGPNLACLVAASVVVAVACRRFIEQADTPGAHLVRAVVIPYVGCLVFLSLFSALLWIRSLVIGGLANLNDTVSLYVMGLTGAALSFFVVIPYGLFLPVRHQGSLSFQRGVFGRLRRQMLRSCRVSLARH